MTPDLRTRHPIKSSGPRVPSRLFASAVDRRRARRVASDSLNTYFLCLRYVPRIAHGSGTGDIQDTRDMGRFKACT